MFLAQLFMERTRGIAVALTFKWHCHHGRAKTDILCMAEHWHPHAVFLSCVLMNLKGELRIFSQLKFTGVRSTQEAKPHSTVGSVVDLKIAGCWFDPLLSKYSFRGLMIVIATGFLPL